MKPIAAGPTRNEIAAPAPENQTQTGTIFETPYVVSCNDRGMNIIIANRQHTKKINRRLLNQMSAALLAELKVESAELGIQLVAAPEITRLNEKFLRHAGPTDVIAFDYTDDVGADVRRLSKPKRGSRSGSETPHVVSYKSIHADIFICLDEAVRQARKFGTNWRLEVVRYLIHGILHQLGFDDASASARRKMRREENRRLRELSRRFPLSKL